MRKLITPILSCLVLAIVAIPVRGGTIQLGIDGDVQIGAGYIAVGNFPTGTIYAPPPGYGTIEISLVNSGIFSTADITTGEFGQLQSLTDATGAITLPSAFMTFNTGGSNLQLWATNVPAGTVGPFTLTSTANGTVGSFDVDGYIFDTNQSKKIGTFTGTFSATFDGLTIPELLTSLPVNAPFTATFTSAAVPVPPAVGAGLLGLTGLFAARWYSARNRRELQV
jgi:hypothetical protein